ncbi:MAG: hypothetical protein KF782_30615 [Labilithrix sp.]|nr:hypothetical protein [Labilithrix sp.]
MGSAAKKSRRFFHVRVALLSFVLFVVVLIAARDVRSRRARTDWDRSLDVAIVLVEAPGAAPVSDAAVQALRERAPALEARLAEEMARHGRTAAPRPFRFRVFGPIAGIPACPAPAGDGVVDLARQALAMRAWLGEVDPRAGVEPDHFDARVYVAVRSPERETSANVEGRSEQGGRIGFVDVELDETMADLTLFVIAHELMHTLGAEDSYDASGRARVPAGLVEPDLQPLYPQRFAEVMARNRPLSPTSEVPPETLDELGVGDVTARAIGWRP